MGVKPSLLADVDPEFQIKALESADRSELALKLIDKYEQINTRGHLSVFILYLGR